MGAGFEKKNSLQTLMFHNTALRFTAERERQRE